MRVATTRLARRWRDGAICRHADPALFFPETDDHATIAQAVAVCRSCPVINACLADALDAREHHGIRGGLTARQRQKLLAARRRTARNYRQHRAVAMGVSR
jgi:WhiB family redox-sensing transcriptional regulator